MRDELGHSVDDDSMRLYDALRAPPRRNRAPWVVFGLAIACMTFMYTANAARDAYFAYACARVGDTWTGRDCKAREEMPPPAQHYTLELPPVLPDSDTPTPPTPPPAPSGQRL